MDGMDELNVEREPMPKVALLKLQYVGHVVRGSVGHYSSFSWWAKEWNHIKRVPKDGLMISSSGREEGEYLQLKIEEHGKPTEAADVAGENDRQLSPTLKEADYMDDRSIYEWTRCGIIQILTGADVNTEKLCSEVV